MLHGASFRYLSSLSWSCIYRRKQPFVFLIISGVKLVNKAEGVIQQISAAAIVVAVVVVVVVVVIFHG